MARIRTIKPEFWEDSKIAERSPIVRLLFVALWNFVDDDGFAEYDTKWLKVKCLPYDKVEIDDLITELVDCKVLEIRNGILWVKNFTKHQKIDKPRPSLLSHKFKDSSKGSESSSKGSDHSTQGKDSIGKDSIGKDIGHLTMTEKDFEEFWTLYPRKVNKRKAKQCFLKLDGSLKEKICAAVLEHKKNVWKDPQFIPHPTTWLNGQRWEDDVIMQKTGVKFGKVWQPPE